MERKGGEERTYRKEERRKGRTRCEKGEQRKWGKRLSEKKRRKERKNEETNTGGENLGGEGQVLETFVVVSLTPGN